MRAGEKIALFIILLVAAILRIYSFSEFSLSNDELSALARLDYSSIYDLIMEGVRIDGHPPAAQVILWCMTKVFGDSVFVVRLPFVLSGIVSVYFVFRMSKTWRNTTVGLMVAALFATLAFPILYSRLARPYALGMLFVSMASFYWIRIVKHQDKPADYYWLALTLALCGLSHYFAALVGAILSILGFFLVGKPKLKKYTMALLGGFILFSPYIPVFLFQVKAGGVGQWLGPPDNNWLWQHVGYAFNHSTLVLLAVLVISISGFATNPSKKNFVNHALPLVLFVLPFLIGFYYSRWVDPVLQNSTLVFSFPFLLVFAFSGWNDVKLEQKLTITTALIMLGVLSTVVSNRFYQTNHFGVFKELAVHVSEWNKKLQGNTLLIGDYNAPSYIHYYLDKSGPLKFDLYRTSDDDGLRNLKLLLSEREADNAIYSWSTVNQSPEIQEIIKDKYFNLVDRRSYFNSEAIWFSKGERPVPDRSFGFEMNDYWVFNNEKLRVDSVYGNCVEVDSDSPYGPTFLLKLDSMLVSSETEIITRIEFAGLNADSEAQLVYEQVNEADGYAWESDMIGKQVISESKDWAVFHYQVKQNENPGILKIYPWLPNGVGFSIHKMEIWIR